MSIRQEYNAEYKKVMQRFRDIHKRGFTFDIDIMPIKKEKPTRRDIERLKKKYTTTEIYKQVYYYDPIEKKTVTGTEEMHLRRSRASKKAAKTRYANKTKNPFTEAGLPPKDTSDILYNFADMARLNYIKDEIDKWTPNVTWSKWLAQEKEREMRTLASILGGALDMLGANRVASNLNSFAEDISKIVWRILYAVSGTNDPDVFYTFYPLDPQYGIDITSMRQAIFGEGGALSVDEAKSIAIDEELNSIQDYDLED